MIQLLGRATSGNVQKVIFLLEELALPYERKDYGKQFENTTTPEYAVMNPMKKVPTLVDGDVVIWQSNTILRYLAGKTPNDLYPANPAQRSQVDRWMDWTLAELNPAYLAGFRDAKKADAERAPDTASNLGNELKLLEGQLSRSAYIAGAKFSLADVCLGPIVKRCIAFPLGLPSFPKTAAWVASLQTRPAFQKATATG
ncbi:MAG: glutathione S-transferase family protein [Pseudomonadota bacterium]|nr:glutathione S-transferase family protein [Pseudomonadota bacterium]